MQGLISLAIALALSLGLGHSAQADLPYEIALTDQDGDGDIDGVDLRNAMAACGTSFGANQGGCTIVLPRQTISLTTTLVIRSAATAYPVGFTFRGQGSCSAANQPAGYSGGTVLRWDGADGGTMIEIRRAYRLRFEDLCLVLDPDMVAGGPAARYGLYFPGDFASSRITQGLSFENVAIWGPSQGTPPSGMTGIYITGTGTPKSAQNDKMHFERCYMRGVDVGIRQDALQALRNSWTEGELFGHSSALEVSGGTFDVRDSIVGCDAPDCVVFNFAWQALAGQQETLLSNLFWESRIASTFLRIGNGWSPINSSAPNSAPVIVENSYLTNQRVGSRGQCQLRLLDAATQSMVVFRGNHLNATTDFDADCGFDFLASNPERYHFAVLYWSENEINPAMPADFMRVRITGSKLRLLALSIDRDTGQIYNDTNLNRRLDPGETAL
jgi:hypothetical protein